MINRYARGLLSYAKTADVLDEVDAQFQQLKSLIESSTELRAFLASPVLSQEMKLSTIEKLLSGELRKDLRNFITLLLERGRGQYVAAIAGRFHEFVDEAHGRLAVQIEAAQPLTQEQTDRIVSQLQAAFGKRIEASVRENRALIAGYRVQVGNRVLDATTSNALRQFRESLLAGAVGKEGTR
ncbi:ATP synthase F1 subunit delta [Alicyclobacillus dauci]|uniref:ATP synthase subunit delta n=1 Tax=Alicyclobacillus dauci TaxID=1475485 RepID=A0ABY6Z290_9BACL|nr:ATP synthase F1 subunit delta [Alicyclobacillus dauci]WAH36865.1 ATP synthase F1 subunit delta [Alicyclobacillus dauci]